MAPQKLGSLTGCRKSPQPTRRQGALAPLTLKSSTTVVTERTSCPVTEEAHLSCIGCQTHPKEMTPIDRGRPQMVQFGGHPQLLFMALIRVIRGEVWSVLWPSWFQDSCAPQILSL